MKILLLLFLSINVYAKNVSVWIIDTGISPTHNQIVSHIAKDQDLKSFNYLDVNGHGTHVTGLILKDTCAQIKIYSCKYFFKDEDIKQQTANECFELALKNHADYVNFSSGGNNEDTIEKILITKLLESGTVIVTSAGNSGEFNPKYYPPAYKFNKLIVVGNLDNNGKRHKTSNYGFKDMVWEYGTQVFSTLPDGKFGYMTGTSQATARHTNRLLKEYCDKH